MAEIVISEDGSHTLFVPELDEHYHSTHGAIQESTHVFIQAGLQFHLQDEMNVLEFGFGTGLNALLTHIYSEDSKITYHTLEKYPIDNHAAEQLNYQQMDNGAFADFFKKMHTSEWGKAITLDKNFILYKQQCDFKDVELPVEQFDLVYFDAFAPDKQPNLWTKSIFEKVYASLKFQGVLTTYCAKGVVRRTLQEVGFKVERLPGPPGKREMLRAIK